MSPNAQPRHILVQLAGDDSISEPLIERLVDIVDSTLRSAFPSATVTVILDHSVLVDRIAVVAPDPGPYEASVQVLLVEARERLRGLSASP